MRPIAPAVLAAVLALACLAAALLAAAPAVAQGMGDIAAGETYFAETCAACHADPAALAGALDQADPAGVRAELEAFLAGHYAEEADDRADVIAYLLSI